MNFIIFSFDVGYRTHHIRRMYLVSIVESLATNLANSDNRLKIEESRH